MRLLLIQNHWNLKIGSNLENKRRRTKRRGLGRTSIIKMQDSIIQLRDIVIYRRQTQGMSAQDRTNQQNSLSPQQQKLQLKNHQKLNQRL